MNVSRSRLAVSCSAVMAIAALAACTSSSSPSPTTSATSPSTATTSSTPSSSSPSTSPKPAAAAKVVRVTSTESDGVTYGIGMPLILKFSPSPTDSTAFTKAVTVKVNGEPVDGAWFWELPYKDEPIEAHFRPKTYWAAHSSVSVNIPIGGLSAGKGLVYDNKLTSLNYSIGAAHVTTVDGASKRLIATSDGQPAFNFGVSLGKATTPTYTGVKVVMERDKVQNMIGTPDDPYNIEVPWSVRLTTSGEFIHSAKWNTGNIGIRSTSNGCTNLTVGDAESYYNWAVEGDIAIYTNTGGRIMQAYDGYGDWNVAWSTWAQGGLLLNH